jgi:hypothetical protein
MGRLPAACFPAMSGCGLAVPPPARPRLALVHTHHLPALQATTAWTIRRARRCWTPQCGSEQGGVLPWLCAWLLGRAALAPCQAWPARSCALTICPSPSTHLRLSYYRFADCGPMFGGPRGYDRVRNAVIGKMDFE